MFVYTINLLAVPCRVLTELLHLFLLLATLRLLLGQFTATRNTRICLALQEIADPLPRSLNNWFATKRGRPVAPWLPWVIVIGTALILRHILVTLLAASIH